MDEYRVVTLWANIAKIAAVGMAASLAWGGACLVLPVTPELAALVGFVVGTVSVLLAALRWETHTIATTTGGGSGE